jgi:hypothetical protein
MSRKARPRRDEVVRYEWPCPGDLVHMDVKRFARFTRPGHAVTGDRHRTGPEKRSGVGYEFAHSAVDDHSRLAYTELYPDERAASITAFTERALWFLRFPRDRGEAADDRQPLLLAPATAACASCSLIGVSATYSSRSAGPQTNGKVERYHQTLKREWALGQRYRSSEHRAQALPHWLNHYNERRRHSAIGDRPPISRVRNVPGQDS